MLGADMKCITWNIEWASAASTRGRFIKGLIEDAAPDVVCFTEATLGMVPKHGHAIASSPDYGYKSPGNRRKVILWSKEPWEDVDTIGSEALPGGRFVTGVTLGVRFIGVCIPWRDAHVRTGRKDREQWEDHRAYLDGFGTIVREYCDEPFPVCVTGDLNQRIPSQRKTMDISHRLSRALDCGMRVVTAGLVDEDDKPLIDHVAVSEELDAQVQEIIPKISPDGVRLSDHSGITTLMGERNL